VALENDSETRTEVIAGTTGEAASGSALPKASGAASVSLVLDLAGLEELLSEDELLRAARFHFEADRVRWVRARASLRMILASYADVPAREVRFATGTHGKPFLVDRSGVRRGVEFSLSHSGKWAMVAVTENVPVGIDIERIRENVDMAALLRRLGEKDLPEGRTSLFNAWARREAMTKALGGALMEAPLGDLRPCHLSAPTGYVAALALVGHHPEVRYCSALVPDPGTTLGPNKLGLTQPM
jgi:phosphopantetheinyl transferase